MEEKYKSIFKKLGIAGFMFFLIKGIMWLIFGTALIKWLKGLMVTSAILCFPLLVYCQTSSQDSLKNYFFNTSIQKNNTAINFSSQYGKRAFFCKLEDHYLQKNKLSFSFRLGSSFYTNSLEYPSQWRLYSTALK
ncbi:MAG: hypothetical protein JNL65_06830 [Saprospiraceae bacterium]|nr:hypothetical protein [Saprospiraceae bacterium]HRG68640.1 hypothetical protein [Saprospiraceae bacterium]